MTPHEIPARASLQYAGQYAGCVDPQRLAQIISESTELASNSKDPETARTRYELAIEAYYQLLALPLPSSDRVSVQAAMASLVEQFPSRVCINEARGLCAKAAKLKTPRRKVEYLHLARDVLERGLASGCGGGREFQELHNQVLAQIAEREAQSDERK